MLKLLALLSAAFPFVAIPCWAYESVVAFVGAYPYQGGFYLEFTSGGARAMSRVWRSCEGEVCFMRISANGDKFETESMEFLSSPISSWASVSPTEEEVTDEVTIRVRGDVAKSLLEMLLKERGLPANSEEVVGSDVVCQRRRIRLVRKPYAPLVPECVVTLKK